jgi:hypothetical protein
MYRPAPIIAGTLAAIFLLFGAYMGAYYALVSQIGVGAHGMVWFAPSYPIESDYINAFFYPAHEIDLWARPEYWDPPRPSPVG